MTCALADARGALRGWADEDTEGRVMTVVEDASVVDYIAVVLDALDLYEAALREIADVPGRSVTTILAERALDGKR